jgi:hypothetical protein
MKRLLKISLVIVLVHIGTIIAACAPASLGSPPASERMERCRTGETLVCRTRDMGPINRDDEREYDFCMCEPLNRGMLY